ncbi:MAG: protein kinase domain-containing protein, partial [Kofleriaceae bacterium]
MLEVVDEETGARRALKIARPGPDAAMLLDEYEQLARLHHPSLPRVYEVGRTREPIEDLPAGSPFFVAEWIAGARSDARDWTAATGGALWTLLADVAGALATIHASGLVHADVAPQNILVDDEGRAVLVDLGFASGSGARGTPAYMAPEALAGQVEPRSDLYGLGATAIRLFTGRAPIEAATHGELVQRIVSGGAMRALPGVPRPLVDLIARLVARDADARPASALAVLDELDQLAPAIAPGSARRARPDVGPPPAPTTWPGARTWIDALGARLSSEVVAVVGPPESGARLLVDAALQARQLEVVARGGRPERVVAGALDEVAAVLGVSAAASTRVWIERLARAAAGSQAPIVIELAGDPRAAEVVAALGRTAAPPRAPRIALVDEVPAAGWPGIAMHRAPVLDADGVAALAEAMLGLAPPRAWSAALHAASGGLPSTVVELVRTIADERDPLAVDWTARTSAGAAELRARSLRATSPGARRAAAAIAVWGGRVRLDRLLATLRAEPAAGHAPSPPSLTCLPTASLSRALSSTTPPSPPPSSPPPSSPPPSSTAPSSTAPSPTHAAPSSAPVRTVSAPAGLAEIAELVRAGLARRVADEVSLDRSTVAAVELVEGTASLEALAEHALGAAAPGEVSLALAPLLERVRLDAGTAELACEVAELLLGHGRADRALAIARRAIDAEPARAGLLAARAAAALGAYREVAALARDAAAAGADRIEAELVVARAAQRAGNLDDAEAALARLHAAHPGHAEVAGTYARLLVTRSRYAHARDIASAGGPLAGLRAEAAGLAGFYLGDLDAADAAFAALEVGATASDDGAAIGRALSLRGMVAQQRGQLGLASDRYREAARRLGEVGELHAAAVAELNLGTVLAERGRASEALPRLAAAGRVFAGLGATTELIAADLNRGNALLAVGQHDDARAAAEAALARAGGAPHLRAFALLVLGDARRRLGDDPGALRAYRDALAIGVERGDAHAQISAHIALAEAGTRDADGIDVEALCASDDDRDRWTLARARLALRGGAVTAELAR